MGTDDVRIAAAAVVTPIGASLAETAANLRAGVSAYAASAWRDSHGEPITVARAQAAESASLRGSAREHRLARLLRDPLARLTAATPTQLFLGLPDGVDPTAVVSHRALRAVRGGRAAGLLAVEAAVRAITDGTCDRAIAGGVDSLIDARVLAELDHARRLRSSANRDGFTPGEAAALLLLERGAGGIALTLGSGLETGRRSDALAAAVRAVVGDHRPREAWSSMTGESRWAKEWAVAAIRNADALDEAELAHPTSACGDTGAASGPLMLALAAHGLARGERPGPALICVSSDGAERAAALVTRAAA
jgi:3-oxoacyl-[acyl-carrier-protein] synthase-1